VIWSTVAFSLPWNDADPLYVNAETIPITTEIATSAPKDISRYLSDEGRFYAEPEEQLLNGRALAGG
jgi:hypothetical protein